MSVHRRQTPSSGGKSLFLFWEEREETKHLLPYVHPGRLALFLPGRPLLHLESLCRGHTLPPVLASIAL